MQVEINHNLLNKTTNHLYSVLILSQFLVTVIIFIIYQ